MILKGELTSSDVLIHWQMLHDFLWKIKLNSLALNDSWVMLKLPLAVNDFILLGRWKIYNVLNQIEVVLIRKTIFDILSRKVFK